ncbi:hypothetical protein [Catenuloplanes japonicus]|uniref:hypothetical protein n=1 Tax=Catenuloplanes japonicus TaxID=33876 RepID=UPI00052730F9|nr:hypothetical protein [Catenuloplanes japonicus]
MTYDENLQWPASEYIGREHRNVDWGDIDYQVDSETAERIVELRRIEQLDDPIDISTRLAREGHTASPATVEWVLEQSVEQS